MSNDAFPFVSWKNEGAAFAFFYKGGKKEKLTEKLKFLFIGHKKAGRFDFPAFKI